jgi:hypothetical protein
MYFDELAHQSKARDGSAACAVLASVLVIDKCAALTTSTKKSPHLSKRLRSDDADGPAK